MLAQALEELQALALALEELPVEPLGELQVSVAALVEPLGELQVSAQVTVEELVRLVLVLE